MENKTNLHMGKILKQLLRDRNISAVKFAPMIGYNFRGVYLMFRRKNFHTGLLHVISHALQHDMFQYLYTEGNSPSEKKMQEKISSLEKEIETLKKENEYLKEIVRLKK